MQFLKCPKCGTVSRWETFGGAIAENPQLLTVFCLNCDYQGPGSTFLRVYAVADPASERMIISSIEALSLANIADVKMRRGEITAKFKRDGSSIGPERIRGLGERVRILCESNERAIRAILSSNEATTRSQS